MKSKRVASLYFGTRGPLTSQIEFPLSKMAGIRYYGNGITVLDGAQVMENIPTK